MTNERPKQLGIMKARTVKENLLHSLGESCFAQPKLRGQRCRTAWVGMSPILNSSYGNAFCFMEHVTDKLFQDFLGLPFDGELYCHNPEFTQQVINGILNRTQNRHKYCEFITYHVFDLITDEPQWKRLSDLDLIFRGKTNPAVRKVPYELIKTKEWLDQANIYLQDGYEGIILRHLNGKYEPLDPLADTKRPSTLLKFKPTKKDNYVIIRVNEGEGWCLGMTGSFTVMSMKDQVTFDVGTGPELTKDKRIHWWKKRNELIGKILVVKHEPTATASGKPICTVAYEVRE